MISKITCHLDRGADEYEEEVGGGEAGQEGVGGGAPLHHRQDDQQVPQHTQGERQPAILLYTERSGGCGIGR